MSLVRFFSLGVAAVDRVYWSILTRNLLTRLLAFIVRGLRVRVDKVRIWKDAGEWEYKAHQFVLAGCAVGVFGSKYSLSVNELYIYLSKRPISSHSSLPPLRANLVLQKGVEIIAYLTPRFFTLLRPRRLAIMDDLRIALNVRDISCSSPNILDATVAHVELELCPGYSRSLRAKLPVVAPVAKRQRKPGILRYWEGNGALHGLAISLKVPVDECTVTQNLLIRNDSLPPCTLDNVKSLPSYSVGGLPCNGVFVRLDSVRVEAFGKAGDERQEAMTSASIHIRGCSAGSSTVDSLSHALYESISTDHAADKQRAGSSTVESIENIEKIVAARPEALVWIEDISAAVDVNFLKRCGMRFDVAGSGGIIALEPIGLVMLSNHLQTFISRYKPTSSKSGGTISLVETESTSSLAETGSTSSLNGIEERPAPLRIVSDLRHWTGIVLGHGPVADSDTTAIVMSMETVIAPNIDITGSSQIRVTCSVANFILSHWTLWARTTNITCKKAELEISKGLKNGRMVRLENAVFDWDLDVQTGLENLPILLKVLKQLNPRAINAGDEKNGNSNASLTLPEQPILERKESVLLPESERLEQREERHRKLLASLACWQVSGKDVSVIVSFPDGPSVGICVGILPSICLNAKTYVGRHIVFTMQEKKFLYGEQLKFNSPLHTMGRETGKRSISMEVQGLALILFHECQFGYLLHDWLLRVRSVIKISRELRLQRRGVPELAARKKHFPDIHFKASGVEFFFEDHPIGGFLTRMLPLLQDETRERLVREEMLDNRIQQLHTVARAEIAGTAQRCIDALQQKSSDIWVDRVRKLKETCPGRRIANGYLPSLPFPPVATMTATTISFSMTLDDQIRQKGSAESIRRLKIFDDYELGSKKYGKTRQYDPEAWNSLGFRAVALDVGGLRIRFRDYHAAFIAVGHMYFDNTTIGQAVQATLPPYLAETTVAIGKRRLAKVVKGLSSSKTYADIHLIIDTLQCGYNPSFLGAIVDFGRGVSRFFSGGKNPSPRIPWFDTIRVNMHGRMRITARKLKGHLTSSISPYSMTKHFVDVEADDFEMLGSRLEATEEDPFPISWKLHNWHIRPSNFDKDSISELVFDFVRVGLNPVISVLSGDAQDHYFVPFPSKEQVAAGGPGIGSGTTSLLFVDIPVNVQDNGFGNFTDWKTGLHDIPGFDSFRDFKTNEMILGIDIRIQHSKANKLRSRRRDGSFINRPYVLKSNSSPEASVVYSDAISTMTKVVKVIVRRPISCRLAPRRVALARKPPSLTGLTTSLRGLDVNIDARDMSIWFYNNLEPGHGLYISIKSLSAELWKRTDVSRTDSGLVNRSSRLTRRRFDIVDIYSSIRAPSLDMAVDFDDIGKLLTVDKISLSDDLRDEQRYIASPCCRGAKGNPASGFGSDDLDESPFYTFSATHPLQRGERLDKVKYDKRLLVDRVRLIWSPVRRVSLLSWPDAIKEKSFAMKAPKVFFSQENEYEADLKDSFETDVQDSIMPTSFIGNIKPDVLQNAKCESLQDGGHHIPALDLSLCSPGQGMNMSGHNVDERFNLSKIQQEKANESLMGKNVVKKALSEPKSPSARHDPLSPPAISMSRLKINAQRRPVGSMVDLLSPFHGKVLFSRNDGQVEDEQSRGPNNVSNEMEVLKTSPKFIMFINDCQVVFGSPETSGIVFLTSNAVRVGIVNKELQKHMQIGEKNERWSNREYRVHLNEANLLTRKKGFGHFNFSNKDWVKDIGKREGRLGLVTRKPICMDLMYISSSSAQRDDGEEEQEDHILRPSLLFINIPDISMSTNADEFHAAIDVVRKVLMQRMKSSEIVNEELANLRYKLQLAGGKVSSEELDEFMRQLNNVTKQFMYAGDTFQHGLVEALELGEEMSFSDTLLRYKAKAKAVATFMRQDQRATSADVLYPTMYVSYSFDKCSWELREAHKDATKETEDAFVEISLKDLVCRHIFYVGRGSSTEMTFGNISAENKMRSGYFQGILQPAGVGSKGPGGSMKMSSRIKASDGAAVAFRWYSTQEDRVGGIPVYDLLTIEVAPMTAAVTRKLYSSVSGFIFSTRSKPNGEGNETILGTKGSSSVSRTGSKSNVDGSGSGMSTDGRLGTMQSGSVGRKMINIQGGENLTGSKMDDVSQMAKRGESSMLFKYVFIDAFELTASYQNKETTARGVLDFFDLLVRTPSFSYCSQVWTWRDFSSQIRKDLVMTFARRGVSNLAKSKLLPGYNRARKRLVQGADSVRDTFRESIYNRLPSSGIGEPEAEYRVGEEEDGIIPETAGSSSSTAEEESTNGANLEGKKSGRVEEMRRERILQILYGSKCGGDSREGGSSVHGGSKVSGDSDVSEEIEGYADAAGLSRGGGGSSGSRSSQGRTSRDGEERRHMSAGLLSKLRRR